MTNLLSVRQVAFILKVHPLSVRRYIKEGKLKAVRAGGNVRIEESELQNFNKALTPKVTSQDVMLRVKKTIIKTFNEDDPFLRLKARGASFVLSEEKKK
jgi:excisionase family DNA binding protein